MPPGTSYFYVAYRVAVGNCKEMNKDGAGHVVSREHLLELNPTVIAPQCHRP